MPHPMAPPHVLPPVQDHALPGTIRRDINPMANGSHPGYHYEYPVKTVDYEPVTRIESVPVTKQI